MVIIKTTLIYMMLFVQPMVAQYNSISASRILAAKLFELNKNLTALNRIDEVNLENAYNEISRLFYTNAEMINPYDLGETKISISDLEIKLFVDFDSKPIIRLVKKNITPNGGSSFVPIKGKLDFSKVTSSRALGGLSHLNPRYRFGSESEIYFEVPLMMSISYVNKKDLDFKQSTRYLPIIIEYLYDELNQKCLISTIKKLKPQEYE